MLRRTPHIQALIHHPSPEPTMTRRHDLDWVRVLAFGLLVVYHVGMYYVSWDWHVKSPRAGNAIEPLMILSAPWRLGLLFLVSGAATAFLLGKQGKGFLRARSWRLLVPLVFGMLVIVPPQAYYEVVEKLPGGYHDGYLAFWLRYLKADPTFCRGEDCLDVPTWNHLWFVAYLWVYTLLLWLAVRLAPAFTARASLRLADALRGWGLFAWPMLVLISARLVLFQIFDSTHGLFDDFYNHAQYFFLFAVGFSIAKADRTWLSIVASRHAAALIAVGGGAFLSFYFARYSGDVKPAESLLQAQRVVWAVLQWSVIVAVLGYARHVAPKDSPALRYLAAAVFPVYILHQTVIVVLAHHLKPYAIAPAVEAVLLVVATVALCFGGYEIIRRVAPLRPLFGLKSLRTRRADRPIPDGAG
jgi:peptidoglycan/LPS O-acetylase OafA/YrhL